VLVPERQRDVYRRGHRHEPTHHAVGQRDGRQADEAAQHEKHQRREQRRYVLGRDPADEDLPGRHDATAILRTAAYNTTAGRARSVSSPTRLTGYATHGSRPAPTLIQNPTRLSPSTTIRVTAAHLRSSRVTTTRSRAARST